MLAIPVCCLPMAESLLLRLDGLGQVMASVRGTPQFAALQADHSTKLEQCISSTTLTMSMAARVNSKLRDMPWNEHQLNRLLAAVAASISTDVEVAGGAGRRKLQDYTAIANCLSDSMWSEVSCVRTHQSRILSIVLQHAVKLGLRCPSEPTIAFLTAMVIFPAEGMMPAVKHTAFKAVKAQLKGLIHDSYRPDVDDRPFLLALPAVPSDIPSVWYKAAFGDGLPVPCKYDLLQLKALAASIPLRSSNKAAYAIPMGESHSQQLMMQMMHQLASSRQGFPPVPPAAIQSQDQSACCGLPNFKMLAGSNGNKSPAGGMQRPSKLTIKDRLEFTSLALTNGTDESPPSEVATAEPPPAPRPPRQPESEVPEQHSPRDDADKPRSSLEEARARLRSAMCAGSKKRPAAAASSRSAKTGKIAQVAQADQQGNETFKPSYAVERSRLQVMCRTGLKGTGQNHAIKFASHGGEKGAVRQAEKWAMDLVDCAALLWWSERRDNNLLVLCV